MSQMELLPYTELDPDEFRREVEQIDNKRELNRRSNNGITVIAYWLMRENVCLIFVHDARTNDATEFIVPNDEVSEWFDHPYAHKDAQVTPYEQRHNHD